MRLPDFIFSNADSILAEWDTFARSIWPVSVASPEDLRDHAASILRAAASDMKTKQTPQQRSDKSKGLGDEQADGGTLNHASADHALGRAASGFDLKAVMAEYRALRASVVRLWLESLPDPHRNDLDDLTRFHESMDQSLAEAVYRYSEHVDKSRQLFLGILGHDLRTPLNAVSLLAQSLLETSRDPETTDTASQIISSNDAAARMLTDFSDFAVSRLGRPMPVTLASMDFVALCREVIAEVATECSRIRLRLDSSGEIRGDWDRARLRQLLTNLIVNAAHHGDPASDVTVTVDKRGSFVTFSVHNHGRPIPEELLPRIFDPLVRGPNSDPRIGSIGLGLYIAREVTVAHGGEIDVISTPAGGTTFKVTLPFRSQQSNEALGAKGSGWSEGSAATTLHEPGALPRA